MSTNYKARQRIRNYFKDQADDIQTPSEDNMALDIIQLLDRMSVLEEVIADLIIQKRLKGTTLERFMDLD